MLCTPHGKGTLDLRQVLEVFRRALLFLGLAVLSLALTPACSRENPEEIATKLAKEWSNSGIDMVSDSLANAATGGIPGLQQLAAASIRDQIKQGTSWTYSKPNKMSGDEYQVIATAAAPISVQVLTFRRSYALSAGFVLVTNTKEKRVVNWRFELGSFRFSQQ